MAAARARAAELHAEARAAVEPFGARAAMLLWLASYSPSQNAAVPLSVVYAYRPSNES